MPDWLPGWTERARGLQSWRTVGLRESRREGEGEAERQEIQLEVRGSAGLDSVARLKLHILKVEPTEFSD